MLGTEVFVCVVSSDDVADFFSQQIMVHDDATLQERFSYRTVKESEIEAICKACCVQNSGDCFYNATPAVNEKLKNGHILVFFKTCWAQAQREAPAAGSLGFFEKAARAATGLFGSSAPATADSAPDAKCMIATYFVHYGGGGGGGGDGFYSTGQKTVYPLWRLTPPPGWHVEELEPDQTTSSDLDASSSLSSLLSSEASSAAAATGAASASLSVLSKPRTSVKPAPEFDQTKSAEPAKPAAVSESMKSFFNTSGWSVDRLGDVLDAATQCGSVDKFAVALRDLAAQFSAPAWPTNPQCDAADSLQRFARALGDFDYSFDDQHGKSVQHQAASLAARAFAMLNGTLQHPVAAVRPALEAFVALQASRNVGGVLEAARCDSLDTFAAALRQLAADFGDADWTAKCSSNAERQASLTRLAHALGDFDYDPDVDQLADEQAAALVVTANSMLNGSAMHPIAGVQPALVVDRVLRAANCDAVSELPLAVHDLAVRFADEGWERMYPNKTSKQNALGAFALALGNLSYTAAGRTLKEQAATLVATAQRLLDSDELHSVELLQSAFVGARARIASARASF